MFGNMSIRVDALILACQEKAIQVQIGLPSDQTELREVFEFSSKNLLAKHNSVSEFQGSQEIHHFMFGNMSIHFDALILAFQEKAIKVLIGLPSDQTELREVF